MRALTLATLVSVLCGCPGGGSSDGGTGGGSGGGTGGGGAADAGLLPLNFDALGLAVFVQGGKVVAAGAGGQTDEPSPGRRPDFFAARTSTDLALDSTFGGGRGFVLHDLDGGATGGLASNIEDAVFGAIPDGDKIVMVGYARAPLATPAGTAAIMRLNADGTPDTTFNGRGYAILDFNPASITENLGVAYSVAKRADGKYVVSGLIDNGARGDDIFMARFSADGALDTTFQLPMNQPLDFGGNESGVDLIVQGNNTVVGGGDGFPIARVTDTGALDMTFGTMGSVKSPGGLMLMLRARADGRLLALGIRSVDVGMSTEHSVLKMFQTSADGVADATFGTAGVAEIDMSFMGPAGDLRGGAFIADGSLILLSHSFQGSRLFKIKPDGTVDTTWGTMGTKPSGMNIGFLGLLTTPRGAHALAVDGSTAYVTGTSMTEIRPGQLVTLFTINKVAL